MSKVTQGNHQATQSLPFAMNSCEQEQLWPYHWWLYLARLHIVL